MLYYDLNYKYVTVKQQHNLNDTIANWNPIEKRLHIIA